MAEHDTERGDAHEGVRRSKMTPRLEDRKKAAAEPEDGQLRQGAWTPGTEAILGLQQTHGNAYVQRMLKSRAVQAKLAVNPPNDQYEREADAVAAAFASKPSPQVQRQPGKDKEEEELQAKLQRQADEEKDEKVQAKAAADAVPEVTEALEERINAERGSGRALPDSLRFSIEPRLGHDFSQVRVHTDSQADGLSRQLGAKAFTTGQDVFFREGNYEPDTTEGRRLIGHELTHVVQQGAAPVSRKAAEEKEGAEPKPAEAPSGKSDAAELLKAVVEKLKTGLQRMYIANLLRWAAACQQVGDDAAAKSALDQAAGVALAVLQRKITTFEVGAAKEDIVRDLLIASQDALFLGADEKKAEEALRKVSLWAEGQLSKAMAKLKKEPSEANVREVLKCGGTAGLLGGDEKLIEASIQQVLVWAEGALAFTMKEMNKAPTQANIDEVLKLARTVELLGGDPKAAREAAVAASTVMSGKTGG